MRTHCDCPPSNRRQSGPLLPERSGLTTLPPTKDAARQTGSIQEPVCRPTFQQVMAVIPFVVVMRPAPPVSAKRSSTASRGDRLVVFPAPAERTASFLLGIRSRTTAFELSGRQARRRATKRGSSSPSCISHTLRHLSLVAKGTLLPRPTVLCLAARQAYFQRTRRCAISGDRTQKLLLTEKRPAYSP